MSAAAPLGPLPATPTSITERVALPAEVMVLEGRYIFCWPFTATTPNAPVLPGATGNDASSGAPPSAASGGAASVAASTGATSAVTSRPASAIGAPESAGTAPPPPPPQPAPLE